MGWFKRMFERATGIDAMRVQVKNMSAAMSAATRILSGRAVGYWSSDHLKESEQYVGWVYCAVSAIADQAAQFEIHPAEIKDDSNALYGVLNNPNPGQGKGEFNASRAIQLMLTGTCVVWNIKQGGPLVAGRYVVPTGLLTPKANGFLIGTLPSRNIWQEYPMSIYFGLSQLKELPYTDCTIYKTASPLSLGDGASPVNAASLWIDLSRMMDTARYVSNQNAPRPGLKVTETDQSDLDADTREALKLEMQGEYSGSENAGKNFWVPRGLEAEPWQTMPIELDHVNSIPQVRDSILAAFRTPGVVVGLTEASSHAAFYSSLLQFTELRMQPIAQIFTDGDRRYLESEAYTIPEEFVWKARRVDDPAQKEARALAMKNTGCGSVNEIRQELGLKPLSDLNNLNDKYNKPIFELIGADDTKMKKVLTPDVGESQMTATTTGISSEK